MSGETGWVDFNDSTIDLPIGIYWVKWVPSFGIAGNYAKLLAEWGKDGYWKIVSTDGSNGDVLEGRVLAYHVMVPPEG